VPELSRTQLLVYGAIAVAVLLIGVRWVRSAEEASPEHGGVALAASEGEGGPDGGFEVAGEGGDVVVHVAGAVRDAGVYRLPAGSRVTDAVERAGGATGEAMADGVNLAARLADGQQVVIPTSSPGGAAAPGLPVTDEGPISLGTATVEQLDTIEGIGPVTAGDIIAFRDDHGGLGSIEELDEVSGIGPATMDALRDRLQP
jgi:competence protein ComEA